jgi:hypothetical protein
MPLGEIWGASPRGARTKAAFHFVSDGNQLLLVPGNLLGLVMQANSAVFLKIPGVLLQSRTEMYL